MKTRLKKGLAWTVGGVLLCGVVAGAYVFTHSGAACCPPPPR
jgi:hypothetical protein